MKVSAANLAVIDLLQHKSISVPVQDICDGVTLSTATRASMGHRPVN